jgi:hypothetical protein
MAMTPDGVIKHLDVIKYISPGVTSPQKLKDLKLESRHYWPGFLTLD